MNPEQLNLDGNMFIKEKKFIFIVLIIALVLNGWAYLHIIKYFPEFANSGDSRWTTVGLSLLKYGEYFYGDKDESGELVPTASTAPVFPVLYYTIFSLVGTDKIAYEIMRVVLILMNIGIIYLSYSIGKIFSYKAGCIAAMMATLDISLFYWEITMKSRIQQSAFLSLLQSII